MNENLTGYPPDELPTDDGDTFQALYVPRGDPYRDPQIVTAEIKHEHAGALEGVTGLVVSLADRGPKVEDDAIGTYREGHVKRLSEATDGFFWSVQGNRVYPISDETRDEILQANEDIEAAKRQSEERSHLAEKAKDRAVFAKARDTGERQVLSKASLGCDGSAVECSMDIVTTYALPNGETETERIHTH